MADITTFLSMRHSLIPSKHFGGIPGRTTTDSLLYLTTRIQNAWRAGKVVRIIFLDIAAAFPNAVTERLLKNMRRRRYPTQLVDFYKAMLKDQRTTLAFDGYTSPEVPIDNGIGQGDPPSLPLYIIYASDLLMIPEGRDEAAAAYVDDTFLVAIADDFT